MEVVLDAEIVAEHAQKAQLAADAEVAAEHAQAAQLAADAEAQLAAVVEEIGSRNFQRMIARTPPPTDGAIDVGAISRILEEPEQPDDTPRQRDGTMPGVPYIWWHSNFMPPHPYMQDEAMPLNGSPEKRL